MKLDPKGLEAAREQPGTNHEAIIRAYIDAIMPVRVSGLVERLRQYEGRSWETTHCYNGVRDEAAISIENLSAGLATVWRGKLEAEDALASERAAHAETKRERDKWRDIFSAMHRQTMAAEAQRDEALKALVEKEAALEPFAELAGEVWADEFGWTDAACQNDRICDWFGPSTFFAARRALTGENERLRPINANLMGDDEDTPRYTTKRLKPEGQQEPVAWQRRILYPENGAVPQWEQCSATEATDQFERSPYHEYRPLFTRPSEQAVTEAMVLAAWNRADKMHPYTYLQNMSALREALKAAMEAGR